MALQWLISFIKNRTFSIKIGNSLSNSARLTSGVPQSSVLGPLLFIIYIIPISHIINKYPKLNTTYMLMILYFIMKSLHYFLNI